MQFIDQHGRPLRLADLRGRPLALSLVYTSCYDVCSSLTLYLRDAVRIARETLGPQSFSVLTVGFDTAHDTPGRGCGYSPRDRGLDDPHWHLVSADAATVRRLADEVGFTWVASPRGFDHVAQVTILDADGRVVRQVYGQDFAPPALVEPLKALVLGRSLGRLVGARPRRTSEAVLLRVRPGLRRVSVRLLDVCRRHPSADACSAWRRSPSSWPAAGSAETGWPAEPNGRICATRVALQACSASNRTLPIPDYLLQFST